MSSKAYIYLEGKIKELLVRHEHEFRTGRAVVEGKEVSFDVEWMCNKIGWTPLAITESLQRMVEDPTNHIVLRFKAKHNPDVIHIDTVVLEFVEKNRADFIMESAMKTVKVDDAATYTIHTFNAAFIAKELALSQNSVACSLRRLAEDSANGLSLNNSASNNPVPMRDDEKVSRAPVAVR